MSFPISFWVGFFIFIVCALVADLGFLNKKDKEMSFRSALNMTIIWVLLASIFCSLIYFYSDKQKAMEFITGYIVELSLSMDNVFVFTLIFSYFKISREYQHRVLFYGIVGAIFMRLFMITGGILLVDYFEWVFYIFGLILIYSAFKIALSKDTTESVSSENVKFIEFMKKFLPITDKLHGHDFTVKIGKKLHYTPLFVVLLIVEKTDLIFAIDSIPAILAITQDTFIVFTSNIFAILGLRSLYFLLVNLMHKFVYLKYGIAVILGFVGLKMLFAVGDSHIPVQFSLLFIVSILVTSIILSWIRTKKRA